MRTPLRRSWRTCVAIPCGLPLDRPTRFRRVQRRSDQYALRISHVLGLAERRKNPRQGP